MSASVTEAPGLRIRPYRAGDRDAVVGLWDRCGLLRSFNDPDRDIGFWRAAGNAEIFVGEVDSRIVASVCVGHDGHRGYPYYVAVDPDARMGGLGRRMMRHAETWLARRGVPKMNVLVRAENEQVCGFYRAIGYEETPRVVFGRWLTEDGQAPSAAAPMQRDLTYTITYLEMTERPSLPPVRLSSRRAVALLRARKPNLGFYRYLYNSIGEDWLWFQRRAMDDDTLTAIIQDDRVEIYVLYIDGVPAGYAEIDRRHEPEIGLAYLGLLPDFVGGGLGSYLLCSAIDTAWSYHPRRLLVDTCSLDHPKALALYQRFGFKPYKQEQKTIPDPRLTGLFTPRP